MKKKPTANRRKKNTRSEKKSDKAPSFFNDSHFNTHVNTHINALTNAWTRIAHQPLSSVLTLLVIGIAIALPTGLYLIIHNAQFVSNEWASALDLSVYVTPGTDDQAIDKLQTQIEAIPQVDGIIYISATDAIKDFKQLSGFGKALEAFDENPLPASFIVRPAALDDKPEQMQELADQLQSLEYVDLVQLDTEWVARFQSILEVIRTAIIVIAVLLAIAVLVIVGNSIRMEVQNRRDEIEVTKLVGGTDAFIRRPFIYTGFWFGLLGGALAILLVSAAIHVMSAPVMRLAGLYNSEFELHGLINWRWAWQWAWLLLISVALTVIGSWFAATRQIRQIEP